MISACILCLIILIYSYTVLTLTMYMIHIFTRTHNGIYCSDSQYVYHSPVRFSLSIFPIHHASVPSFLPNIVVPPEDITWLLFDSVIPTSGSWLESWSSGIVNYYMLVTSKLHYRFLSYQLIVQQSRSLLFPIFIIISTAITISN